MSESVVPYEAKTLEGFNPFRAMDKLDDKLILDELEGRVSKVWVYQFPQDGKMVEGLSKIGIDQACREMANKGEVIREGNLKYTVDPTDNRFVLFSGEASRFAVSKDGTQIELDRVIGTKRQCIKIVTKQEGISNRTNPFFFEQGAMKAFRNARSRLLSEETRAKIITLAKEVGKTREVKPEDDIPEENSQNTSDASSEGEINRMVYEIAQKQNKTPESILEGFTAPMQKDAAGKWHKTGGGVETLAQYRGDKNKLFEKISKYYSKAGA